MIRRSKIRSLNPYLKIMPESSDMYAGVINPPEDLLRRMGFSAALTNGETILPRAIGAHKKIALYNAEGKNIVHRNQPMETAYRTVDWHWKERHGKYNTIERSKFVDVPYKRYPRTYIEPPAVELTLYTDANGRRVVSSPKIVNWRANSVNTLHSINLILELFGECNIFDSQHKQFIDAPLRKVNWTLLPKGERSYTELREHIKPVLDRLENGKRNFAEHRLDRINAYGPEFLAVGRAGFTGYIVFAFPAKNIFLLESIIYGNATYVLGKDWEQVSKMTKAEVLKEEIHKQRIIHRANWFEHIRRLFS